MFTRFKLLSAVFFFLLSFVFVTILWGENGYYERKGMERDIEKLEAYVNDREMELALLGERQSGEKKSNTNDMELVYSFEEDYIESERSVTDISGEGYVGQSIWRCALYALIPTLFYTLLIYLLPIVLKKKDRGIKEKNEYGGNY